MELVKNTITSLEIAEISGKRHDDVLRAIRKMEESWVKIGQRKFTESSYINSQGKKQPCYDLTKTECLYIATKFNDEARAKLVLRWEKLETQKARYNSPLHYRRQAQHAALIPVGYFSMVSEFCATVMAPLEEQGAPVEDLDKLLPDISIGRMFCGFLRRNGQDPDKLPTYPHKTAHGIIVQAKLYPEDLIAPFRRFLRNEWLPKRGQEYLVKKSPKLENYLPKLLK